MPAESKVYEYVANTVKVWDEARKWKKYTMDVFGDLVKVEEPKPAADTGHVGNYFTSYSYDVLGHLTRVEMTRGAATQVRTFNYEYQVDRPGAYLLSAQHPESGTVAYTYNPDGTLATKVDAKGQKTELVYDSNKRVTQVKKYPSVGAPEDEAARVELSYDTNPYEAGYSAYAAGRLTARQYKVNGLTFTEMYSYTRPGQVAKKKLRVGKYFEQPYPYPGSWAYGALEGRWEYNAEGKMTKVTYPAAAGGGGQSYVYGYDSMGRLKTMGPQEAQTSVVSDVTYGPAGEMLTMTGMVNESRGYNSRLQLTSFNGVSYGYGASNNGRIASESVSGETVVYQYDELNRLMRAETQGDVWGQEFIYDGFGNLTDKRVTKGSAPSLSVPVDGNTNRAIGYPYDANGNQLWTNTQTLSYDYENRIAWVDDRNFSGRMYGYNPDNRRVYEARWDLVNGTTVYSQGVVHFWGVTGQRMGSYGLSLDAGQPPYYGPSVTLTLSSDRVYFGGRLLKGESGWTGEDRLGSVGQFYPYGEARVGDPKRFATYERDGGGLDYAVNRYYWVGTGRFMTPDPYMANSGGAGDVGDPGSWNRYGYVGGDPVNFHDPAGLEAIMPTFRITVYGQAAPSGFDGSFVAGAALGMYFALGNLWMESDMGWQQGEGGGGTTTQRIVVDEMEFIDPSDTGTHQDTINGLLRFIRESIDADCSRWLLSNSEYSSIDAYLDTLVQHNLIGHANIRDLQNDQAVVNAVTGSGAGGLAIAVNRNGAVFNSSAPRSAGSQFNRQISGIRAGSQRQGVFTLIHEFAHSLAANGFRSDRGSSDNTRSNNDDVWRNCSRTIAGARN
jgi:RHS repeat-associated protein